MLKDGGQDRIPACPPEEYFAMKVIRRARGTEGF